MSKLKELRTFLHGRNVTVRNEPAPYQRWIFLPAGALAAGSPETDLAPPFSLCRGAGFTPPRRDPRMMAG